MSTNTKIIAVAGKGGVGKTSIAAATVKNLVQAFPGAKILAIDADPAVGLSTALGVTTTGTIDDIRKSIIESVEEGQDDDAIALLGEARFRIFDTMVEQDGFAFIPVGRPESSGCYCKVNSYLKEVISLLACEFDYVVIDGEAGIEQINRRVMEKVSHLLLITDSSRKGIQVIQTIKDVAQDLVMYDETGVIINRITEPSLMNYVDTGDIPVLAHIPEDRDLTSFDILGKSILKLPNESNVICGVKEALKEINIL